MKVINSVRLEAHREEFNLIADFINNKLKVDVRKNTKSRAHNLPDYRCLFFNIVLETTTKIDKATIGGFLGKDHATVIHAEKMWNNYVKDSLGKYLLEYLELKNKKQLSIIDYQALEVEEKIESLENEIVSLKLELDAQKNNIIKNTTNRHLMSLMELDDDSVRFFIKTRLEPFLKMNKLNNLTKTTKKLLNIDVIV